MVRNKLSGDSKNIVLPTFWKGVYSLRKYFVPKGKFLSFGVESISEEDKVQEYKQEVTKFVSLVKRDKKAIKI